MLATFTAVLCIAPGEVLLRMRFDDISRITGMTDWETSTWKGVTYHWDVHHPSLGWTNLPGYRSDARVPFEVEINGQGLRARHDYPARPRDGIRRIALFGDSLAFGEEVNTDETVSHYLERALSGTEVLNFGVHGYGLGQIMLRFEEEASAFHPDQVLVMLTLPHDVERALQDRFAHSKPVFAVREGRLVMGNTPVPITSELPWLLRRSYLAAFLFARAQPWVGEHDLGAQSAVLRLLLERLDAGARKHGVPWKLVTVTSSRDLRQLRSSPEARAALDTLQQSIEESGVDTLDAIPYLRFILRREGPALSAPNWHWSARGNCLLAYYIARDLARSGSFALSERSGEDSPCGARPRGRTPALRTPTAPTPPMA